MKGIKLIDVVFLAQSMLYVLKIVFCFAENAPDANDLATAYSSGILTYVALVIDLPPAPQSTRLDAQTDPISINVGNNSKSKGYVNQELTPLTGYR